MHRQPEGFFVTTILLVLLQGCGVLFHHDEETIPKIAFPALYTTNKCSVDTERLDLSKPWWLVYKNEQLSDLIEKGLNSNFSLQAAWERLKQSEAILKITNGNEYPIVGINGSASRTQTKTSLLSSGANESSGKIKKTLYNNSFSVGPSLSYEVDLWGRAHSATESSRFLLSASRADLENTALILSGQIASLWLNAQVQKATLDLLREQIEVSRRLLKLTKLRFRVGQSSALDVYQQEEQLSATLSEVPLARSVLRQTINQLAVMTGQMPSQIKAKTFTGILPSLPPLPSLNSPVEILTTRPDLRAVRDQLRSAQLDVAAAVAARFPSINFSLSYNFNAEKISDILSGQIGQVLGSMFMPIFEGGRLQAQVQEREANANVIKNLYSETVLTAFQDVQNALIAEREQGKYVSILDDQLKFAEARLRESRLRYVNGVSDYLEVTLALQSVQYLQRAQISNRGDLILARNRLYLALGGDWTNSLKQSEAMSQ